VRKVLKFFKVASNHLLIANKLSALANLITIHKDT